MTPQETVEKLKLRFPDAVRNVVEFRDETTVLVPSERIVEICRFLKGECGFDMLTDLSGVDNFGEEPRFEVDYVLCSLAHRCHLRLKVKVAEDDLVVDTVTGVWRTADWHEREAYRHVRPPFPRASEPETDSDVGRIPVFSAAEGFPARRTSRRTARDGGGRGYRTIRADAGRDHSLAAREHAARYVASRASTTRWRNSRRS